MVHVVLIVDGIIDKNISNIKVKIEIDNHFETFSFQ